MSGVLAFVAAATQGTPLDLLALESGVFVFLGGTASTWNCNKQRDSSWKTTTLGHRTDSRLKHTPSLSVKETYLLIAEHWPERQASGLAHN